MIGEVDSFVSIVGNFTSQIYSGYESQLFNLAVYTFAMVFYAIIIWNYYHHLARRDIFKIYTHPSWKGRILSFLKYIFLYPIISFIWFLVLVVFMFFLMKNQATETILLISVTLVSAVRISAYYNEDLSRDLAKLIPFVLLGVFIVDPSFFSFELVKERILTAPTLLSLALRFLLFVFLVELFLRIIYNIGNWIGSRGKKKTRIKSSDEILKKKGI